jgi:hypothetical protein
MRHILLGFAASFTLMFATSTLEAATWRISFDVTDSSIGYSELSNRSTGQQVAAGSAEFTDFTRANHTQGAALGQTGRVRLEVITGPETLYSGGSFADGDLHSISCLSGFLCNIGTTDFMGSMGLFERSYTAGTLTSERFDPADAGAYQSHWAFDFSADTGALWFLDDGAAYGSGLLGGDIYDWVNPNGRFDLGNINRVQLIPNPLPTPVVLLGAALLPMAWIRRRKHRV